MSNLSFTYKQNHVAIIPIKKLGQIFLGPGFTSLFKDVAVLLTSLFTKTSGKIFVAAFYFAKR